MAAILMLGDTVVAEWSGAGPVPWPISFAPLGITTTNAAVTSSWPMYSKAVDTQGELRGWKGSPVPVTGLSIVQAFFIYRLSYWYDEYDGWGQGSSGNTENITSPVATLGDGPPLPLTWTGVGRVVFKETAHMPFRVAGASLTAVLGNSNAPYISGNPIAEVDDSVIITAAPMSDGEGHDESTASSRVFWKWVCEETQEEFATEQITVSAPSSGETRTYTAFWKPNSVLVEVEAGDNGIEVAHYAKAGLYYSKSATGEPAMPLFYARVVVGQETDRAFNRWTKTVYSIDAATGGETAGTPVTIAATADPAYPTYEAVQTVRETGDLVSRVVYRAYSSYSHDRAASSIANTYLLKGAAYTLAPAGSARFGDDGYAGAYGLTYAQPTGVDYIVRCRRAGDLAAGTFTDTDSGTFVDSETGKVWRASYILYAVDAEGVPVGPAEDPTVPEDPDDPDLPGVGGDGGSGTPVGTGMSLQIVSADIGVTAGSAALSIGGTAILEVTYPAAPIDVKSATQGAVYMLTVTGVTPAAAIVVSVTANGTALVASGGKWPVVAGTGATSVVVTLGFPPLKTLLTSVVSVPGADPDNTVTVLPAPTIAPDRWIAGTVLTLTPVPVAGYSHISWTRDDAAGGHDEEAGGSEYAFALDADTVVTAGFRKPSLDVVLSVKGSTALAAEFDWTYEAADADDAVPGTMTHVMFVGAQLGLFKNGLITFEAADYPSRLQTSGDAAYNDYVDMPINGVDVSYDGGVTWEDAGGDYPDAYNVQTAATTPAGAKQGRPSARVGKHTVNRIPLNDTLHVRVRLVATVSVSVGMPPVRWGGPPTWSAAGSMIGTGQNNWGCGLGAASISGVNAEGVEQTAVMSYHTNTLANPESVSPIVTLPAQEAAPYPNYFNEYPWIEVELGDTVTAVSTPDTGYYFAAWIDGYFSHDWEDSGEAVTSEDRLVWPVGNYISSTATAVITVNEGMKKIMLKMKAVVAARYVLFTQDAGNILATRPGETAPELIRPSIYWQTGQDLTGAGLGVRYMRFTPTASAAYTGTFAQLLTAWDVTDVEMAALGIATGDGTVSAIWKVNKDSLVATTAERIGFGAFLSWSMSGTPWYDVANNSFPPEYLGVYRRVHLTNAAGTHEVGEWEFVGRGNVDLTDGVYWCTYLPGLAQKFFVDIEYRVRWVPYVAPTTPDEPYQLTVGYHEIDDMEQGVVSAEIAGVPTGDINSRILTPTVQPADEVILRAVPRAGYDFVSWVDAAGTVVSTEAAHTVDPDTEGFVFLATFTASIVVDPVNTTEFHVGFVAGNAGRGSILVRIWRADTTVENYTVTAAAGATYQLLAGDNAYAVAIAATGFNFVGWVDSYGLPRGSVAGYYPLADAGASGTALHRDVFFSTQVDPVVTGNVPFRAGFLNPADVPHALGLVSVNGVLVATLNGLQQIDMMLTEGDSVSMEIVAVAGYVLSGFVSRAYVALAAPVLVQNVSVTNQGLLAVLGLAAPPVDPLPDIIPGTPVSGAGLWLFDGGTDNKAFVWRSRRFETPIPTEFNSVRVSRNGAFFPSAVAFRLNAYSSPETSSASTDIDIPIVDDVPRRLPKIRRERYFEIEVAARDDIECVKVASSMGELQNG